MAMDLKYYFSDSDNDQVVVMKQEDGAYIRKIASGGTVRESLNPKGIMMREEFILRIMKTTGCRIENGGSCVLGNNRFSQAHGALQSRRMVHFM